MYIRGPKCSEKSNAEAKYWRLEAGHPSRPMQTRPPEAQIRPETANAASISEASSSTDLLQQPAPTRQQQHLRGQGVSEPSGWGNAGAAEHGGSVKGQSWRSYHSQTYRRDGADARSSDGYRAATSKASTSKASSSTHPILQTAPARLLQHSRWHGDSELYKCGKTDDAEHRAPKGGGPVKHVAGHGGSQGQSWQSYHSDQGWTRTSTAWSYEANETWRGSARPETDEANETWRGCARPDTAHVEKTSVSRSPGISRNESAWRDPKRIASDGYSSAQSKACAKKRQSLQQRSDESSSDETVLRLQLQ